ncbi:hypothetical protein [Actinophytocola sp. NPDC049390]|uniref:hypothetical protein n=1 Tax=Actinophytocola sp. NPDC049390 TaxID=3363894 RepID=UPI00379B4992
MRTRTFVSALAIGALVVPLTSAMSAPAAPQGRPCTAQWQLVPTPEQTTGLVEARTVSAISGKDVRISGSVNGTTSWSMTWNGRSITETSTPSPGLRRSVDNVRSSSYASPEEGWLLLDLPPRADAGIDTAAHWQDGRWTLTPTAVPDDPVTGGVLQLMSVTSLAPDDAWAVGHRTDPQGLPLGLIEHWDGTRWTVADHPEATARGTQLLDVTAVSPTDVWAVGQVSPETGGWTDSRPLVMRYDGSAWTTVSTPEVPADRRPAKLSSVSVTDDGHVWAVGLQGAAESVFGQPLILRHDGSGWQELPDPDIGDRVNVVGVYATSEHDAWVVATHGDGAPSTLLHWDGTGWQSAEWPGPKLYGHRYYATDIAGTGPNDIWVSGAVARLEGTGGTMIPVTATPQVAHLSCGRK